MSTPAPDNAADRAPDHADSGASPPLPAPVSYWQAFAFWLKLGFVSFGGPAGQIALMHTELVERRRWISERRFLHALNYCMVLPGPEAQQLATYIGWLMHRSLGGITAGALFVLPSLLILILLSWVYIALGSLPVVAGLLYGIKPAVVAIVVHAAHRIAKRALKDPWLWAIAAAAFVAIFAAHVPFPAIVLAAAALGALGGKLAPQRFATGGGHGKAGSGHGPALIDDATPTPPHARYRPARLAAVLAGGALLWALPLALLTAQAGGWQGTLPQMGWFFTKAALLTFGGAYAVLPYVYQGAVVQHGWLSPTQMIDGLALGETTPGPLIMVVAFVGFIGGWQSTALHATLFGGYGAGGPAALLLAGALAATVATWFTFLPSFVFILAGGPLVEATHGDLKLTAPLTAITAAVVGVILNLALFFGWHTLWPQGWVSAGAGGTGNGTPGALGWGPGGLDIPAALMALAAAVALFRYQRNVIHVILASAVVGLGVYGARVAGWF